MSGIPENRKLWITPLSPVHMGTDEDYTPTGYVIEGNALYEFDEKALENLPEVERRSLDKLLAGRPSQDMLKRVQAFFYENREWLIPVANNVVHVSKALASLYRDRIGKAATIERGGKEVQNRLEIERAAYNPLDRRLILPGSGLKGAMRTALLDAVNRGQRTEAGERNRELQQRLFHYSMRELNNDPMRLVQVGDCAWHGPDQLNSAEILFAINRKKHAVMKDGKEVVSQAEQRNLYQLLECAAPFRFRAYQGLLTVSDMSRLNNNPKLPQLKFSFGEIAAACNRFYRPIFDAEVEMLRRRGFLDGEWYDTVNKLIDAPAIRERLDNGDAFLLRVGRHSGAESVTLNGVRSIKIIQGRGKNSAWEPKAKTIWLASGECQDRRFLRPFGWLLVELTKVDQSPPNLAQADDLIDRATNRMGKWLEEIKSYQHQLFQSMERTRQEAERRASEAAEAEKAAKEEEKRLASLSEEEKLIENVRKQLQEDQAMKRKEAGGQLNEKRLALLAQAESWGDAGLRKKAAQVICETVNWLPWSKKRKKEMQSRLEALEK